MITGKRIFYFLLLLAGIFIAVYHSSTSYRKDIEISKDSSEKSSTSESNPDLFSENTPGQNAIDNLNIPPYVFEVYNYIITKGKAPTGYVGGRIFQNREKRLNLYDRTGTKIMYREWDVHPKIKGKNRGAERLVTGSDSTAYYTPDHYKTFILIYP